MEPVLAPRLPALLPIYQTPCLNKVSIFLYSSQNTQRLSFCDKRKEITLKPHDYHIFDHICELFCMEMVFITVPPFFCVCSVVVAVRVSQWLRIACREDFNILLFIFMVFWLRIHNRKKKPFWKMERMPSICFNGARRHLFSLLNYPYAGYFYSKIDIGGRLTRIRFWKWK